MSNSPSHGLRFGWLSTELIIVVIGVIIALSIESWWSGIKDAEREQKHLEALHEEFSGNLQLVNENMATLNRIKGAAVNLLTIIVGEAERPDADSLVTMTWWAFSFPPYEPMTTAYDNAIATGDIALIRDQQLKADLANFTRLVERYRRGEWQLEQWNLVLQQFVVKEMVPLDWLPAEYRNRHGLPDPSERTNWDGLLQSREFEGVLANRVIACDDNLRNLGRIKPVAQRIVERLNFLLEQK